jgi:hypothetical protein
VSLQVDIDASEIDTDGEASLFTTVDTDWGSNADMESVYGAEWHKVIEKSTDKTQADIDRARHIRRTESAIRGVVPIAAITAAFEQLPSANAEGIGVPMNPNAWSITDSVIVLQIVIIAVITVIAYECTKGKMKTMQQWMSSWKLREGKKAEVQAGPTKEEEQERAIAEATLRLEAIEDKILTANLVFERATQEARQLERQIMASRITLQDLLTQRVPNTHAELLVPTHPHVHQLYHRDGHCLHKQGCGASGSVRLYPTRLCRLCFPGAIVLHPRPSSVTGD